MTDKELLKILTDSILLAEESHEFREKAEFIPGLIGLDHGIGKNYHGCTLCKIWYDLNTRKDELWLK